MTIALIIFSVTCNYDILSETLPAGREIVGFFGLFALDFGLLCWLFWTTRASAPGIQRIIGVLMVIVDLVGVAAGIIGDMMLNFDPTTRESIGLVAVQVIEFVIIANIAGAIAAEITSPEQAMRDAKRAVTHELDRKKAEHLINNASEIAADVAITEAKHWADQAIASFSGNGSSKGNGPARVYQKDAPTSEVGDEFAQARTTIERLGGKVISPRAH